MSYFSCFKKKTTLRFKVPILEECFISTDRIAFQINPLHMTRDELFEYVTCP